MDFSIDYRGLVVDITINEDVTICSYVKNSNTYKFNISDVVTSKKTKSIKVPYSLVITDSDGNYVGGSQHEPEVKGTIYNEMYNLVAERSQGDFRDRGSVDFVLEYHFNEQVYPFDKDDNYNEGQPIIYDLVVNEGEMSVNLVNYDNTKSILYSVDNVNWRETNSFSDLINGEHTLYIKYLGGYVFSKSFTINVSEEDGD